MGSARGPAEQSFSALQRAENSSIETVDGGSNARRVFQCSSASRKFLNSRRRLSRNPSLTVSVLFSEPKIPQSTLRPLLKHRSRCFSALQRAENSSILDNINLSYLPRQFQCSSASRKFLNPICIPNHCARLCVSVLFSEPKIPQYNTSTAVAATCAACFSALQRAENSSIPSQLTR